MSKWINKDLFNKMAKEKKAEASDEKKNAQFRRDIVWPTPEKGTVERANTYVGRFLVDKSGEMFYKKYFFHFFSVGEKFFSHLCPKTHDMNNFCLTCAVNQALWKSQSDNDKREARRYKRNQKFVANWFIVDDPRDTNRDAEDKMNGTVKLWEFPKVIESKVKNEIVDDNEGLKEAIFDPSKNGYNFIVKVKSKPPDPYGQVWPDYADSVFSRKASAIADKESDIDKIMESTYNIKEYIDSLVRKEEDIINALKEANVWELVEDEWERLNKTSKRVEKEVKEIEEDDEDESQAIEDALNDSSDEDDLDEAFSKPVDDEPEAEANDDSEWDEEELLKQLEM